MKESKEGSKEGGQEERHKQKERTEERRKAKFPERKNAVPALHRSLAVPNSATGTRTRVARVRAEYPNQLDYSGSCQALEPLHQPFEFRTTATLFPIIQELRRRP
jgi:hypothetical protein